MYVKKVWEGIDVKTLTLQQNKNVISSKMIREAEHLADGAFDILVGTK
jgi:hypothetical protein